MFRSSSFELAARQQGVISRSQLVAHGTSTSSISRARAAGVLVDLAPGVYRFASSPVTFEMRCRAACTVTSPVGYLNGWTAARLMGLRKMPDVPVHLTVPLTTQRSVPDWVECHRSRWYDDDDFIVRSDGLSVATPERMLFALAAAFNQFRFERAAEDAWHLGLVTPSSAASYLERHRCRGKDGVLTLERWLERSLAQNRPSQSGLERALLEALERRELPTPVRQHPVVLAGGETIHVDIAWPDIRLAVEPGASWWHGGDAGQRRDQARDRATAELGWLTVRFDEAMRQDVETAADQVVQIFHRRRADTRFVRITGP